MALSQQGYTILCTSLQPGAVTMHELFPLYPFKWQWKPPSDNRQTASELGPKTAAAQSLPVLQIPLPPQQKTAVVFGNELKGCSAAFLKACDGHFWIPMPGFTGSLNISVACAITLHHIAAYKRVLLNKPSDLDDESINRLADSWIGREKNG